MTDGIVVILSYPDTVVRPAYTEFSSKIWPLFGVGNKHAVQAGHAALLLVHKKTGAIDYYDFGRYITKFGFGRVRSKHTDVELEIPLKANCVNNEIKNIEEILLWLEKHPHKTHGEGRLVASVNSCINYKKAQEYIINLQSKKEVAYGTFVNPGSNCARFVSDTLMASTVHKKSKRKLKTSCWFTPSPISNVIKGSTTDKIYNVYQQKIVLYTNRSSIKEHWSCFLNRFDDELNVIGTELPNMDLFSLDKGTWLGGIGSGAWFLIENEKDGMYTISRFQYNGVQDFSDVFTVNKSGFDLCKSYKFQYPTSCLQAFVEQEGEVYLFSRVAN